MILCCGETLIDFVAVELPDGRMAHLPCAGGAAFNTALTIARLGGPSGVMSGISTDMFGRMLSDRLAAEGIDAGHICLSDRPSTLAFVNLDHANPQFAFFDENSAGRRLDPQTLPSVAPDVRMLHFAGVSLITEPSGSAFEQLARSAGEDRLVWVDPNIRPALVRDAAAYRARLHRMFALADVIKISTEDLSWFDPTLSPSDFALSCLTGRTSLVLVTDSAEGASAFQPARFLRIPAPVVSVIDTVGAGDVFSGAFLFQLLQTRKPAREAITTLEPDQLASMLAFAVRAASFSVTRTGADSPTFAELEAWQPCTSTAVLSQPG